MESVILTEHDLEEAVSYILTKDAFAFDIEASGQNRGVPHIANVCWLSLATEGYACAIPFGHSIGSKIIGEQKIPMTYKTGKRAGQTYYRTEPQWDQPPDQLSKADVFRIVRPLFESDLLKIGHDLVYDLTGTAQEQCLGAIPYPPYFDTKIAMWMLDENAYSRGLKNETKKTFGFVYDDEEVGAEVEKYPFDIVAYYSFCDAQYAYLNYKYLYPQIAEQNLEGIFDLEMEVLHVMVKMRQVGARVDTDRLEQLHVELTARLEAQEAAVYAAAGKKFNIGSVPQKQELLYGPVDQGNQGLKPWKLTQGGLKKMEKYDFPTRLAYLGGATGSPLTIRDYSTDQGVLESYVGNPLAESLAEHAVTSKILGTYVDGWLGYGDNDRLIYDDHIHAGFLQYGTVTGRFSCRAPNLQNLPRPYTDLGRYIRETFIADPDGVLVVGDYSQIELVVLAHYVGEGALFDGFWQGIDPHRITAAMVLGKRPEDVTKEERQDLGKTLGFAVCYGAGINKVASMARVTPKRAKEILKRHEQMFPEIHGFRQQVIDLCRSREDHSIRTIMGRKRRIPYIVSRSDEWRTRAERQLFNSLIQGSAADIIKLGMVNTDNLLPDDIRITLTVHDEIVMTAPRSKEALAVSLLEDGMTGPKIASLLKVPIKADIHSVDRWSEAK